MTHRIRSFALYTSLSLAIASWWYAAFQQPTKSDPSFTQPLPQAELPFQRVLSSLDRSKIQNALTGDYSLMAKLIMDWDIDAQIMESHGLIGVKRLPRKRYLRSQVIERQLSNQKPRYRYLPQTYAAADFLLALTEPDEIVGLPPGFRKRKDFFPTSIMTQIPLDLDRYHSEKIHQAHPDLAFVAYYSHPTTLQALRNQGIELHTIGDINTYPQVTSAILEIGSLINRPLKAELLTHFMESALLAIDNHLLATHDQITKSHDTRIMFLNYHAQYAIPTERTITGNLLARLSSHKISVIGPKSDSLRIPIDQEQIANYNPDCLIVAASDRDKMKHKIYSTPAFQEIKAVKNANVFVVNDDIQTSPTQYLILAYYDLAQAITQLQR